MENAQSYEDVVKHRIMVGTKTPEIRIELIFSKFDDFANHIRVKADSLRLQALQCKDAWNTNNILREAKAFEQISAMLGKEVDSLRKLYLV